MLQSTQKWKGLFRTANVRRCLCDPTSRSCRSLYVIPEQPWSAASKCLYAPPLSRPPHTPFILPNTNTTNHTTGALHTPFFFQYQQMRWKGRNDGNRYSAGEPRKPTKKQRKTYHRLLQKQQMAKDKHGAPGSKAGIRRQYAQQQKEAFLQEARNPTPALPPSSDTYDWADALLDDAIGNVKMATPTPEPAYLGHQHRFYYNQVVDQMDDYFAASTATAETTTTATATAETTAENAASTAVTTTIQAELPSDEMISKALRAFRDKNGTRYSSPVGIIPALQHVLYDMQVPLHALGEYTFTTLLTCCRTPQEGRRVLQLIREQGHVVSAYSWTILCDLHAKAHDVAGCVQVQQEMLHHGISPTLPSYTSLFAACYRVAINGRVPHSVRASASQVGWDKWQELRILGIEPDAMAYGAILRLKAATGKAEECLNLLHEMNRFGVHPTTLCFASALRGVARSHAIAVRYEKGASRRNRRREEITLHHGKLARQVVILAESAAIVPDDGYVSALCLCAAAAGDVATAKAIYIASEIIRTQKDLRRIGSDVHLARLRGEYVPEEEEDVKRMFENPSLMEGGGAGLTNVSSAQDPLNSVLHASNYIANGSEWSASSSSEMDRPRKKSYIPSFGEREYGKDNRVLSSILHACAQAVDPSGMGTIWQGRENNGYLCLNSLRLIAQPKLPEYSDNSIPGQSMTDNLRIKNAHRDDYREGKRQPRKFPGIEVDDNVASNMDEITEDHDYARRYLNSDGRWKKEYRKTTPAELWRMKYGDDWDKEMKDPEPATEEVKSIGSSAEDPPSTASSVASDLITKEPTIQAILPSADMYFDYDTMRWKPTSEQPSSTATAVPDAGSLEKEEMYLDSDTKRGATGSSTTVDGGTPEKVLSSSVDLESAEDVENLELEEKDVEEEEDKEELPSDWKMEDFETLKKELLSSELNGENVDDEKDAEVEWLSDFEVDDLDEDEEDELSSDWEVEDLDDDKLEEALSFAEKTNRPVNEELEKFQFDESKQQWVPPSKDSEEKSFNSNDVSDASNNLHPDTSVFSHSSQPVLTEFESKIASGELKPPVADPTISTSRPPKKASKVDSKAKAIDDEEAFAVFFADLQKESVESGQGEVTEEEGRELFEMMKDEYNEFIGMSPEELGLENHPDLPRQTGNNLSESIDDDSTDVRNGVQDIPTTPTDVVARASTAAALAQSKEQSLEAGSPHLTETRQESFSATESIAYQNTTSSTEMFGSDAVFSTHTRQESFSATESIAHQNTMSNTEKFGSDAVFSTQNVGVSAQSITFDPSSFMADFSQAENVSTNDHVEESNTSTSLSTQDDEFDVDEYQTSHSDSQGYEVLQPEEPKRDFRLERLRQLLPTFPEKRLKKILRTYEKSLSDPSILELVPIVRENMPDYITATWLKQMSWLTANFVIQRAAQDDNVNTEILNAVLELQTSAGSLDRAIEFHQTEFERHNLEPTQYSDRLVLQMLLRNNRFNRALSFKQIVENSGRSVDLKSYGSLIEYCSRRQQLGSAMLLLKECLSVHGAPPSEASLTHIRQLCRQAGIEEEIGLGSMIGKDPIEWLRQGEREHKREYSKKGRRDVQLARNAAVGI